MITPDNRIITVDVTLDYLFDPGLIKGVKMVAAKYKWDTYYLSLNVSIDSDTVQLNDNAVIRVYSELGDLDEEGVEYLKDDLTDKLRSPVRFIRGDSILVDEDTPVESVPQLIFETCIKDLLYLH